MICEISQHSNRLNSYFTSAGNLASLRHSMGTHTSSFFKLFIQSPNTSLPWSKFFYNLKAPFKVKAFVWIMILDRINTNDCFKLRLNKAYYLKFVWCIPKVQRQTTISFCTVKCLGIFGIGCSVSFMRVGFVQLNLGHC